MERKRNNTSIYFVFSYLEQHQAINDWLFMTWLIIPNSFTSLLIFYSIDIELIYLYTVNLTYLT